MSDLDLSECEREPIHLPGSVQMHGVLVAVDERSGLVTHVSANSGLCLPGKPRDLLGTAWSSVATELGLEPDLALVPLAPEAKLCAASTGQPLSVRAHRWRGRALWELEPVPAHEAMDARPFADPLASEHASNVFRACQLTAEAYAKATGYDRVMVYHFHPDWTGEVVAEVRRADALPYLGLRYPASDIPSQARELLLLQPLRVIADVQGVASELLAAPGEGPLDCSHVTIRGVSPYHLEYLRNMGVGASIASSLVVDGRLWGLMVGHHNTPRRCPAPRAAHATALGNRLAAWIAEHERAEAVRTRQRAAVERTALAHVFENATAGEALRALLFGRLSLQNLLDARGAAVITKDALCAVGSCPDAAWLRGLYTWAVESHRPRPDAPSVRAFSSLPAELALPPQNDEPIAGCLVGVGAVPSDAPAVLVCFRPEVAEEVSWGGDPATPAIRDAQQRLRPRKSFALWQETSRGKSRPWTSAQTNRMGVVVACLERTLAAVRGAALSSAIRDLLDLKDRDPRHAQLDLAAHHEGIALVLDVMQGKHLRLHDANPGVFELLGIDPLFDNDKSLAEVLAGSSIELAQLDQPRSRLEFWSPTRGMRVLETERRRALLVVHGDVQRAWQTVHFIDVTQPHRLMQAMTAARDQARQTELSQTALLSNMTHEMRTPLTAINGLAELLRDDPSITAEQRNEFLEHIRDAGQHLLGLVNDLLDVADHEAGRLTLDEGDLFDLVQLASTTLAWIRPLAERKNVSVGSLESALVNAPVKADRQRIRQVMVNLLGNAVKFTPSNGAVQCRVGEDANHSLFFEVRDSGIGIPAAQVNRVFERFFRGHDANVAGTEGAGLGLAISKALVELHGGAIHLSSTYGVGTIVRFTLPSWRRK